MALQTLFKLLFLSMYVFIREGWKIKRFQYTAIDDATRIRALKIYDRHTQANAIDFVDYVIKLFPFRITILERITGMSSRRNSIGMLRI